MTPFQDKLKQIKARAEAATDGPWHFELERYSAKCVVGVKPVDDRWIAHAQPEFNGEQNARFIAYARTDVPKLIAVIEAMQKEIIEVYESEWPAWSAREKTQDIQNKCAKILEE